MALMEKIMTFEYDYDLLRGCIKSTQFIFRRKEDLRTLGPKTQVQKGMGSMLQCIDPVSFWVCGSYICVQITLYPIFCLFWCSLFPSISLFFILFGVFVVIYLNPFCLSQTVQALCC